MSLPDTLPPGIQHELSELRLLEAFLGHSSEAFFAIRVRDGRVIYVNDAAGRLYGYSRDELLAMTVDQVSAAYDDVTLAERMREYRERGRVVFETLHRTKDGRQIPVEVSLGYVPGETEDHTVGVVRSLEERRRMAAALAEAEQRWQIAVDASNRGVWDWQAETGQIYFSARCAALLGFAAEPRQMDRETWFSQVHLDDRAAVSAALDAHFHGMSEAFRSEHRARNADGGFTWVQSVGKVVGRDTVGRPLRMAGTLTDVDARRRGELLQQTRLAVLHQVLQSRRAEPVYAEITQRMEAVQSDWKVSIIVIDPASRRMQCVSAPSLPASLSALIGGLLPAPGVGTCGTAIASGERCLTSDILVDPGWAQWHELAVALALRACWSVPFKDDDGQVRGSLAVYRRRPGQPRQDELELIEEFARIAALAEQRTRALQTKRMAAAVFDNTHDGVVITDLKPAIVAANQAFSRISGYGLEELLGQNPSLLKSGRHGAEFYADMWSRLTEQGLWQGEIWNRRKSGEIYPQWVTLSVVRDDAGLPSHYVGVCTDISQAKHSERELERLAHYDQLTGLPNRLLGQSRLAHAIDRAARRQGQVAVIFLDLDHFKTVNDSLGHPVGDELLTAFARRASSRLRAEDTLARLGGDEFLLVLESIERPRDAALVAQALLDMLEMPFVLQQGLELYLGASVGISVYPRDGTDVDALIQHADSAMYQAKTQGRHTLRFYSEALTRQANERLALEAGLRRALVNDELELHYQPQMRRADAVTLGGPDMEFDLLGMEALVRWHHPELGLTPPARFIALAEDTGLIHALGDWVLAHACRQARAWVDAGQPMRVAVNLSARQFGQRDLVAQVRQTLADSGLAPQLLELEITESALIDHPELAVRTLEELVELGVSLAIDDFGTGYSSLAYLKRLPVNRLKIDRSFVTGLPGDGRDQAIVQAILTLARNLGMSTLAEGVETEEQWACLESLGCDSLQGHLHAPAMPAAQAMDWVLDLQQRSR